MTTTSDSRSVAPLQLKPGEPRPVEPGMSRRHFLRNASLVAVASAIPLSATLATVSALPALIEANRAARQAFEQVALDVEAAELALEKVDSPLVPLSLTPDGRRPSGMLDLAVYSPEGIEREIRETHAKLREKHISPYQQIMAPAGCEEMARNLDASLTSCLRALADAVKQRRRLEDAAGLTEANERWSALRIELGSSMISVLAHTPASPAEAAMKAEWLAALLDERQYHLMVDEFDALVGSIAGQAVQA